MRLLTAAAILLLSAILSAQSQIVVPPLKPGETVTITVSAAPAVQPPPPPPPVSGPLAGRVLVVANTLYPTSSIVAAHYMNARGVPVGNLCSLTVPWPGWTTWDDNMPQPAYDAVRAGIRACVDRVGRSVVLYIVMTPGVPYRVFTPALGGGRSIDAQVAALWDDLTPPGAPNRYATADKSALNIYLPFQSFQAWRDSTPMPQPTYSVWRLWGDEAGANRLVDDALAVEAAGGLKGIACIDAKYGKTTVSLPDVGYAAGDNDLLRAADATRAAGLETVLDVNDAEFGTAPAPLRCENAALYAGWYGFGTYNDAFSFAKGAVAWHLDSQSIAWGTQALPHGVIATSGAIAEPFMGLFALAHPDGVMRDLLAGALVGDAFWRHTDFIDKIVQIGDPLYRPFPMP